MPDISEAMVEAMTEVAIDGPGYVSFYPSFNDCRRLLEAALSAAPASAQMDELSRLREANRKLHRRVQVAERFQAAVGGQTEDLWRFYKSICPNKDMEYWAAWMHRAVCRRLTVSRAEVAALRESLPTAGDEKP